jgi:hypothetical protein
LTAAPPAQIDAGVVARHDEALEQLLPKQITDPANPWRGGYADGDGLYQAYAGLTILQVGIPAWLCPQSRFHHSAAVAERIRLATGYLDHIQKPDGNFDSLTTNYNSPPDTAFIVHLLGSLAVLAQRGGAREIFGWLEGGLRRAGAAIAVGGVHTPNHRWAVCAALSQIHEMLPDPAYVRRIDQWLAKGIDIDSDGQYTERSTTVYNPLVDWCLTTMAIKLNRPELLEPVRRNLDAMLYLIEPGGEVVTGISRRQDRHQRGTMISYWFPLAYLAHRDGNGVYQELANQLGQPGLSTLMEYPILSEPGPRPAPLPEDFEKVFPHIGCARVRRANASATLLLHRDSRFLSLRHGDAVIEAVRFASAFFGRGTFLPQQWERQGRSFHLTQTLEGPYYQPLDPPRQVGPDEWGATIASRRRSEVCHIEQSATITEKQGGFRLRIQARGYARVPVAIEINLREGGKLEGCEPSGKLAGAWMLPSGYATYRVGANGIRFGPGRREHTYLEVRGGEHKLPGLSVYLTGAAPLDHTLEFEWV